MGYGFSGFKPAADLQVWVGWDKFTALMKDEFILAFRNTGNEFD